MYQIINTETGELIEESVNPTWVKQQERADCPLTTYNLEEADGVVLSDQETYLGIENRNMENYTPLVTIKEVSSDPYVFAQLEAMQDQIDAVHTYQTEETVLRSELDTAYTQGVNTI